MTNRIGIGRIMILATATFASFNLVGCGALFDSPAQNDKPIRLEKKEVICVRDLGTNMKAWFETGSSDIGASVDCAVRAIDHFTSHVEGSNKNAYTQGELAEFVESYLAKAESDLAADANNWTGELLRIKQLVYGGSDEAISKQEIQNLRSLLVRAKPLLQDVTPEISAIFFREAELETGRATRAGLAIEKVLNFLALEFEGSKGRPVWTATDLLKSVSRIGVEARELYSWVPVAEMAKEFLLGGDRTEIQPEEWANVLRTIGRIWKLALEFKYEVSKQQDLLGQGLPKLENFVFDAIALVEDSSKLQIAPSARSGFSDFVARKAFGHAVSGSEWMKDILRIKQLVYGGESNEITTEEIAKFRGLILKSKPVLREVWPNIPVALMQAKGAAPGVATQTGKSLDKLIELLAKEFESATPGRPVWTSNDIIEVLKVGGLSDETLASWKPLAEIAKEALAGGDRAKVESNEWGRLVRSVGRVWKIAVAYKYDVEPQEDKFGRGLPQFESLVFGAIDVLEGAAKAQKQIDGVAIGNARLAEIVDHLAAKEILPKDIRPVTIKALMPIVFGKLLYGVSKPDSAKKSRGLSLEHLPRIREAARNWVEGQRLLLKSLDTNLALPAEALAHGVSAQTFRSSDFASAIEFNAANRAKEQLVQLLTKGHPLVHDERGRLVITAKRDIPPLARREINKLNAIRVLVEVILRAYAKDAKASESIAGLLDTEAQDVYLDLREIGKDLGAMDVRNNTAGTRTFMEASLFASVANGSSRLELQEGVEWFHFVLAAGSLADKVHASTLEKNCAVDKLDIFGKKKLDLACFRRVFMSEFDEKFANMPRLVNWAKQGNRKAELVRALERAGRTKGVTEEPIDSSELRSVVPILHYTESLFATHDKNLNDKLDHSELWAAFPIIKPFIKKMGNGQADGERMQKAIFSYLVTFGEPPEPSLLGGGKLIGWMLIRGLRKDEADRLDVAKVIGSFGEASRQDRMRRIEKYLKDNKKSLPGKMSAREPKTQKEMTELFQCLEPAEALVGNLLHAKINSLAPNGKLQEADKFIANVKGWLERDPQLEKLCLPF